MKKTIIIAAAAAMALSSCGLLTKKGAYGIGNAERLVESSTPVFSPTTAIGVLNGRWTITSADGAPIALPAEQDLAPTLTFELDEAGKGKIYSYTVVNYGNGDVTVSPKSGAIAIADNFMSTLMAASPEAMELESKINYGLVHMTGFRIERNGNAYTLRLTDPQGRDLICATRWDSGFLNGAWEVTEIQGQEISPEDGLQLTLDIPMERLHGNTGCNIINGTLRVATDRVNGIELTNLATTRRACDARRESLERMMVSALGRVVSASATADGEGAILRDANGNALMHLRRLALKR